jgi:transposase InsO family protein
LVFAGWVDRRQQDVIEQLREESRVLRKQPGDRRIRFTDVQRCRLGVRAKRVGRRRISEAATLVTPDTLLVVVVIDLKTRRVETADISRSPEGQWMTQLSRNLTDAESGSLRSAHYLIHDRDPLFTKEFAKRLEVSGVRPVKLPTRSPNLNAYAERFVRSIKSECLAQIIPLGGEAEPPNLAAETNTGCRAFQAGNPRSRVGTRKAVIAKTRRTRADFSACARRGAASLRAGRQNGGGGSLGGTRLWRKNP